MKALFQLVAHESGFRSEAFTMEPSQLSNVLKSMVVDKPDIEDDYVLLLGLLEEDKDFEFSKSALITVKTFIRLHEPPIPEVEEHGVGDPYTAGVDNNLDWLEEEKLDVLKDLQNRI